MPFWKGILNLALALGRLLPSPGLWASVALLVIVVRATVNYADGLMPVTLIVDGVSQQVRTQCSTVGEVLDDVGVVVHDWDRVTPGRDLPVQPKMTIAVQHAHSVTIVADGTTRTVYTHQQAVDAILRETGLDLRSGDRLWVNGQLVVDGRDDPAALRTLLGADEHAASSTGHAASSTGHAAGSTGHAAGSTGHAAGSTGHAASSTEHAAGSTEHAAGSTDPRPPGDGSGSRAASFNRADSSTSSISHIKVQRATLYYLNDDGVEQALRTTSRTVGQALHEAQVLLYLGDRVYPNLNAPVSTGLRVRIQRGVPVSVLVDGRTLRTRTHRKTVGEVLTELGVSLVGKDFVVPSLDAKVEGNQRIRVVRVVEKAIIEQKEIPFQTEWIPDSSLELDLYRVDDIGSNGLDRRRYKAIYQDGQEVERYLEDEWVAREPQSRKIAYGTRIVVRTLETPDGPIEYWRRVRVFLTSYTEATCGKTPDHPLYGITRLGWKMRRGIIAVDPRVIRLRTQLYVPGYGPGVAGDTGGMIRGRHIDLGFDVDNFVMYFEWGYVYVLTPVPPPNQIRWILPDFPRERSDGRISSFTGS